MKTAVGIDIVTIARFEQWHHYSITQLLRVFTVEEIEYAYQDSRLFAQRLAVRFAAREAFLKAVQQLHTHEQLSLWTCIRAISIKKLPSGMPVVHLRQEWVKKLIKEISVSLSHSVCCASAVIHISQ